MAATPARFAHARARWAALVLLLLGMARPTAAQPGSGETTLTGRVLSSEGAPVPLANVRATPAAGGAPLATQTDAAGRYRLVLPAAGRYELKVERVGYFGLTVEVVAEPGSAQRDLRLTTRAVEIAPVRTVVSAPVNRPPAGRTPGGQDEAGLAAFDLDSPLEPGNLSELAALRRGVVPLGSDGALSIGGQPPSQNGVTLDGASFGSTTLPPDALRGTAVATSTFDPSKGQFSGGQIAATTLSGTNLFGGVARLRLGHPALQASAGRGAAGGGEYRLAQLSGGAGGMLVRDRFFWYGALLATHRSAPLVTLQSADAALLRNLGVDPDSARRLRDIAQRVGYTARPEREPDGQVTNAASGLLRLDLKLGSVHVLMGRLDGRTTRLQGFAESPLALAGSGGEVRARSGGVMLQLTSYLRGTRNELRAYASSGDQRTHPDLPGPSADVRVGSDLGGTGGSALLHFGGSAVGPSDARSSLRELSDELVVPLGGRRGRARLGFLLNREAVERGAAAAPPGTFSFASLADLEANQPAAFTRTLGQRGSRATADYLGVFAGHLWSPAEGLSLIYGVRLEGRRYPGGAAGTAELEPLTSARPGAVPPEWGVSPRVGFSYEPAGGSWSVRGGVGEFRGKVPVQALASARAETGEADVAELVCIGPAAPAPDWRLYDADPGAAPTACADGVAVFASRAPHATVFAPGFGAPRTWHATLGWGWSGTLRWLGLVALTGDASWIRGLSQPVARDLNFAAAPGFTLPDEGGRTVYAAPAEVDTLTGGVAPGASRRVPALGRVREVASDGRSSVAELSLGVSMLTRWRDVVALYYTWSRVHDQVGALFAPGGYSAPLSGSAAGVLAGGPSDLERRHLFQLRYTHRVRPLAMEIGVVGRLVSGAPYTPRVAADVNGDGESNDAAFVFDPAVARDTAVAAGMARLLERAPESTRHCLLGQLGRVAERNRCRAPWTAELNLQANVWPGQRGRTRRFMATITASNVLGGVDRLLHGAGGLRGWGQSATPDPTLLTVRGFDRAARAFRYEVNPGFGTPLPGRNPFGQPFTLTLQGRWTLGSDPIRQPLLSVFSSVRVQGRTPAQIRQELAKTIPNLPAQVLALDDTLRLELSSGQRVRLGTAADSLAGRLAPLTDSLATAISASETAPEREAGAAREQVGALSGRAQEVLDESLRTLREILTPQQWNRLPAAVQQPARQLLPPRGFTFNTGEVW